MIVLCNNQETELQNLKLGSSIQQQMNNHVNNILKQT